MYEFGVTAVRHILTIKNVGVGRFNYVLGVILYIFLNFRVITERVPLLRANIITH